MAIGLVSDDEFLSDEEVRENAGLTRALALVKELEIGRGAKSETPDFIRTLVAQEALNGIPAKEVSERYNVSESSVSAYKKGATSTSTYNEPKKELRKHVDIFRERISKRASRIANGALKSITDDDLESLEPKDAIDIALKASAIVKNMAPEREEKEIGPAVQFILYAPKLKSEEDYEVVEAVHD